MMRILKAGGKFLFPAFLLLLFCSEAPKIKNEPTSRVVLAEDFSYARCTYCPYAEDALDSLFKEFADSLAVIIYHRRLLGDTLSPPCVAVRESLYQITTSPTVVFDGIHKVQTEDPNQNYPIYKNYIVSRRNEQSRLKFMLETDLNGSSVNLVLSIVVCDSIEAGNYSLMTVLYEDSVYFRQPGAPDTIFDYVVRMMIPDADGDSISLVYPDSIVKETNFILKSNWDINKLGIVAFIQDMNTKEVLQAVVKHRITN